MSVDLSILVANSVSLAVQGYTRIEVWMSSDEGGTYEEVTAASAAAAYLTSSEASTTFRMGGKLLKFKLNGASEQSVSFSDTVDYWTPAQVAARINEVAAGRASVVDNCIVLTSATTGRTSTVEITYCDADDLGWTSADKAYGKAARITLVSGTFSYSFADPAGSTSYRYKWRFSANGSEPISDYTNPVYASVPASISSGSLSVCSANFADIEGKPVIRSVIVAQVSSPQSVGGYLVASDETKVFTSDANGFLQFTLVRGTRVRVAIEGTSFVREFTVPSASTFDLLTVTAAAEDPFTVQSVSTPLTRRAL